MRRPNPLDPDEIQMQAMGELMDEHMSKYPTDDWDAAYDAICFKIQARAERIFADRISAMIDQREHA